MTCFTIDGKSLHRYCLKHNIDYQRVYYWLEKGFKIKESLKMAEKRYCHSNSRYMLKNKSLHSFCKDNGISYFFVRGLLNKGVELEDAIKEGKTHISKIGRPTKYFVGETPLAQFCKENNIDVKRVFSLMRGGRSLKQAINKIRGGK